MRHKTFRLVLLSMPPLWAGMVTAQTPADAAEEVSEVVVTGTRVADRSALDTAVPVDVVTSEALRNIGISEVAQALSVALPSLNFPRPGLSDGSDTIRPATLRGLAPDQTLVLLNGKRRHAAALVNVNATVGRGSAAVDLNTIPGAMLGSVEVLRDGASAQYGSDAIAGVINLRLRENSSGGEFAASYGGRVSSYDVLVGSAPAGAGWAVPSTLGRDRSDGEVLTASVWKGLPLGPDGFVTIAAEYKDQNHTERSGYDVRQQYPLVAGAFDPRELTFDRYNGWYGEPDLKEKTAFVNAGYDLGNAKLYGWASYQDRDALSAGFYRRALDDRNIIAIYPNGFLPLIAPAVTDYSAAVGALWSIGDWELDSSLVYGKNKIQFTIENTLNRSIGPTSKTVFDSGGYDYDQLVLNLAAVRPVKLSGFYSPLNVALGLEARREGYGIFAGEPDSYRQGGVPLASGAIAAPGAQVFPGFQPADVTDEHRTAVGAYIDLEANVTEKLLASVAVRGEHYSDFGENVTGKFSARYDVSDDFAIRGSVQNGFRAPSLQQQFYRSVSTNFVVGVPVDILTLPATSPIPVALGAQPLTAEESTNFSLGLVMKFGLFSLTIDGYRIDIDDRIVLTENLGAASSPTQANVSAYLASQGFPSIGAARFFINGVDTETTGVDVVANYPLSLAAAGRLDLTLSANFNSTDVTRVPTTGPLAALSPSPVLFDRINVLTFEEGTPKNKVALAGNWKLNRFGATLRATRYGEVLTPLSNANALIDNLSGAAVLVDLEGRFEVTDKLRLAAGADNVLDKYPDPLLPSYNTTGTQSFSNYSAYGRSGRFIYGKLTYSF